MYIKETILGYALQVLEQFKRLIMSNQRASVTTGYADKWDVVLLGGLIGSLFSFLQFVVSPKIGRASDRLGRRTVLLYTMVSCGFIQIFFFFFRLNGDFLGGQYFIHFGLVVCSLIQFVLGRSNHCWFK